MIRFVLIIQSVLFLSHLFLYQTWAFSHNGGKFWLGLSLGLLSVSFVSASLLAFRYNNLVLRAFYKVAAVWLGWLTFLVIAAVLAWIVLAISTVAAVHLSFHPLVECLFGAAVLTGIYAVVNANWTRAVRVAVQLPNLPSAWRGRKVALVSDLHLGHVRNGGFLRRIVANILQEAPDAIFIAGDLYDGTTLDVQRAAEPLRDLIAPFGVYFVAGNHEQFGDDTPYLRAVADAGVRVLRGEKVNVDGLQIAGVSYRDAVRVESLRPILRRMSIDRTRASIFLTHAPDHPDLAEEEGFSLQLSGHTHLGQFIPFTWIVRRIYGQFAYGLSRVGNMQVFTSSGAGTWGPPLRLGSSSEIVIFDLK